MWVVLWVPESRTRGIWCSGSQPWPRRVSIAFPLLSRHQQVPRSSGCPPLSSASVPGAPRGSAEAALSLPESLPCALRKGSPVTSSSGDTAGQETSAKMSWQKLERTSSGYTAASLNSPLSLQLLLSGFCPHPASGELSIHPSIHPPIHSFTCSLRNTLSFHSRGRLESEQGRAAA